MFVIPMIYFCDECYLKTIPVETWSLSFTIWIINNIADHLTFLRKVMAVIISDEDLLSDSLYPLFARPGSDWGRGPSRGRDWCRGRGWGRDIGGRGSAIPDYHPIHGILVSFGEKLYFRCVKYSKMAVFCLKNHCFY